MAVGDRCEAGKSPPQDILFACRTLPQASGQQLDLRKIAVFPFPAPPNAPPKYDFNLQTFNDRNCSLIKKIPTDVSISCRVVVEQMGKYKYFRRSH